MESYHEPVLLREVVDALDLQRGAWYLDATLGDGGHSLGILKLGGRVLGIDVDPQAIKRSKKRFEQIGIDKGRYCLIQGNFRHLKELIKHNDLGQDKFKGILFDLGVSNLQLEDPNRGFSFIRDGPLDMRMDPNLGVRAADLVNALNKGELNELFTKLGQEKNAKALAAALVSARQVNPIQTTKGLAEIVEMVVKKRGKIHPATKLFQALRIAVNDELNVLKEALPQALEFLNKNGRLVVISFHSLDDRIIKNKFRDWEALGKGYVLTNKPVVPSPDEIRKNPKSRSAKLRVFEKV